jgi:Leucine-rich repeat (LRR) protein
MNNYRFTSTSYWNYTQPEYDGLIITKPIPPDAIQRKMPNLKAIRIEFHKTGFKKSEETHFEYLKSILSHCPLQYLSIQGSEELEELPTRINQHRLHELVILNCQKLSDFSILSELSHLENLQISNNNVRLSQRFFEQIPLKAFHITAKRFEGIEFLPKLNTLKELTLADLEIEELPPDFHQLTHLKNLTFRQLKNLNKIPRLNKLTQLETVNWWGLPKIDSIPDDFRGLKNLNKFSINAVGTDFENMVLPPSIPQNTTIKTLSLANVPIQELPDTFTSESKLHTVSFERLLIQKLPESFRNLQKLEYLIIGGCPCLTSINPIGNLRSLKQINLKKLEALPALDFKLENLYSLEILHFNFLPKVEQIPAFGQGHNYLNKIQFISLPELKSLPESINLCYELVDLRIRDCGIETLPESLKSLRKLKELQIYNCPNLSYIPSEIFPVGTSNFIVYGCPKIQKDKSLEIRHLIKNVKEKMSPQFHPIMAYWIFNNKGKEPFTDEIKRMTLEALSETNAELNSFLFRSINQLNPNGNSFENVKIQPGDKVSILGTTQVKKTLLRKQLEDSGFKYSQKITDDVTYILMGKKPKLPDNLWNHERLFFSEVEFAEWQKNFNPGMLQKDETPPEFLINIRRLLWSNIPSNELIALEMVINHGFPEALWMDFIAATKIGEDTKVRGKIRKFLKGHLKGGPLKLLNDTSKVIQKHPRFYVFENYVSYPQLGQFVLSIYKRTGLYLKRFFGYDDGSSPHRKELFQKILPSLVTNSKYLNISIGLTEDEINEVLRQPNFKGNLQRLVINSMNVKAVPSAVYDHMTLKDLQLGVNLQFETIPSEIFELTKLTKLNIRAHSLKSIPPEIGKLTRLKELFVYTENPVSVPNELKTLPKLTRSYFSKGVVE